MSSRLLTMKFMQRAAATAAANESQTPGSDDNTPSPKRRRLSTEAESSGTPQSDLDAISAALNAEEQKRRDAVMRQAADAGESQWVLDIPVANVRPAQPYAVAADSLDVEDKSVGGRRAFGNFQRKQNTRPQPQNDDEDDEQLDPETREKKRREKKLREQIKNNPDRSMKHVTSISGGGLQVRPSSDSSKKDKKKKRKSS